MPTAEMGEDNGGFGRHAADNRSSVSTNSSVPSSKKTRNKMASTERILQPLPPSPHAPADVDRLEQWLESKLAPLRVQVARLEKSSHRAEEALAALQAGGQPPQTTPRGPDVLRECSTGPELQNVSSCNTHSETRRMSAVREDAMNRGYALQESVWDAALLVGHPLIPRFESLFAAFLLILNVFIQGVFLAGSGTLAADAAVDEGVEKGFKLWRLHVAHQVDEMDTISRVSLAQRVCSQEEFNFLSQSPFQATAVRDLNQFLEDFGPLSIPQGPLMCACALVVWYFMLSTELSGTVDFLRAVWRLPVGELRLEKGGDDGAVKVVSIPHYRKRSLTVVMLLRCTVALTLQYTGTKFLISSQQVGDLLLNVAALEIIFNVDELLFKACATCSFQGAIETLEPLPLPPKKMYPGVLRFVFVAVVTAIAVPVLLAPDTVSRNRGLAALCGGRQDFVFGVDDRGIITWASTNPSEEGDSVVEWDCSVYPDVWSELPVVDVTQGWTSSMVIKDIMCNATSAVQTTESLKRPTIFNGQFSVRNTIDGNIPVECVNSLECFHGGYDARNVSCDGQQLANHDVMLQWSLAISILQELQEDASLSSCDQLASRCLEDSSVGYRVRQWCPLTCGCHNPASDNLLANTGNGCPACFRRRKGWLAENLPYEGCADSTWAELTGAGWKGNWKPMWENTKITTRVSSYPPEGIEILTKLADDMLARGCDALPTWQQYFALFEPLGGSVAIDLCSGGGYYSMMKPIDIWCPATCGTCPVASSSNGSVGGIR